MINIIRELFIQEIKNRLDNKFFIFLAILFLFPYIMFFTRHNSYVFRDALDVYTFMFEGILPLIFVFLTVIIYVGGFSRLLNDRFIVYLRMRAPLKEILISCFLSNAFLTFIVFFLFAFNLFIFSYYIEPILGLVKYQPEVYSLTEKTVILDSYKRFTFTQLLEYGNFVYGFTYSIWIGINAIIYSSLGFFTVILFSKKLIGISFPVLFYIIGSFIFGFSSTLMPYRMADTIFPFSIGQQSIWTNLTTISFLIVINLFLYFFTFKMKITSLENTM
jgi:hypothetical protein